MGIITWGIGITRIELEANYSPTFLHVISASINFCLVIVPKRFGFINQTDMVKTSLNMDIKLVKNVNSILKLRIILLIKNYICLFN